jgi:hypothetical protein
MQETARILYAALVGLLLVLPSYSDATMFCNMDNAGGNAGQKAQESSARAAAAFMQAASTTFQMFAQLELHLVGEKDALRTAADLSTQSTGQIERTLSQLREIAVERDALKAINETLSQVQNFGVAFQRARISPDSSIGKLISAALQNRAEGLLRVCTETVEQLRSSDMPMGRVYLTISNRESPAPEVLWAAMAQWNETFAKGRLISSVFATFPK